MCYYFCYGHKERVTLTTSDLKCIKQADVKPFWRHVIRFHVKSHSQSGTFVDLIHKQIERSSCLHLSALAERQQL